MNRRAIMMALRKALGRGGGMLPKGGTPRVAAHADEVVERAWRSDPATSEGMDYALKAGRTQRRMARRMEASAPRSSITGKTNYGEDMPARLPARTGNASPISAVEREFEGAARTKKLSARQEREAAKRRREAAYRRSLGLED